ncbi:hypothetical protein QWZ10_22200 [Paracoccus cavernae]|uniref:Uncharacterized protein n=1 Tax=Paracoccus cavernae TaxID=1571207 RepID=A0ABT8DBI8_9RHOB|nr:hypothetical protein [Paracoccus cavernae]
MKTRAPKPQPLLLEREHFERELTEAKAIYQRLFDDRKLSLFLNEGRDPRYAHPHVHEGEQTIQPEVFRAAFLGKMSFPNPMNMHRKHRFLSIFRRRRPRANWPLTVTIGPCRSHQVDLSRLASLVRKDPLCGRDAALE